MAARPSGSCGSTCRRTLDYEHSFYPKRAWGAGRSLLAIPLRLSGQKGPGDTIEAPAQQVVAFLEAPANLPRWAVGFAKAVHRTTTGWIVQTGAGEMGIRIDAPTEAVCNLLRRRAAL